MVVVVAGEEVVVTPAETKVVVFSAAGKGPPHNFALVAWHPYIYINVLPLILKCRILLTSDAPCCTSSINTCFRYVLLILQHTISQKELHCIIVFST